VAIRLFRVLLLYRGLGGYPTITVTAPVPRIRWLSLTEVKVELPYVWENGSIDPRYLDLGTRLR
jgi:hypothetical protein